MIGSQPGVESLNQCSYFGKTELEWVKYYSFDPLQWTREHSLERISPPRHTEIGTVSLLTSSRYIGLNFNESLLLIFTSADRAAAGDRTHDCRKFDALTTRLPSHRSRVQVDNHRMTNVLFAYAARYQLTILWMHYMT